MIKNVYEYHREEVCTMVLGGGRDWEGGGGGRGSPWLHCGGGVGMDKFSDIVRFPPFLDLVENIPQERKCLF